MKKQKVRMMRKDRTFDKKEMFCVCFSKNHTMFRSNSIRDVQDVFVRTLLMHTRKVDSVIWREAGKNQKARISIDMLTDKEKQTVGNFMRKLLHY